jgi:glycosyltransferase involved in cell wall biosynthesis
VEAGTGSDVFTKTLAESLEQRGHDAHVTRFRHGWQYVPWRLRLAREPEHTQVIVANSWNAFAFKRSGIPLVSVEHHLVLDPALAPYRSSAQAVFHETLVRRFERLSADRADAIVAVSNYTAQQLQRHLGVSESQVIYNGIDTAFFTPQPRSQRGDRPMRLLFVGTLSRRKGADLLPQIVQRLGPEFELLFTGEGNKLVGPGPGLTPLGRPGREALRDAYQDADLLLFPTRLEGLGLVALEAMACGTPVVASRTGPLPEIIDDGTNGRLCAVDDVDAFADAIRELKDNPDLLAQMGEAARTTVEAAFSVERMTDGYLALFDRLLGPATRA